MASAEPWRERHPRAGWDISYTPVGGRLRNGSLGWVATAEQAKRLQRRTSQAFIAVTSARDVASADVEYFAAIARRLLQRGRTPPVPPAVERALCAGIDAAAVSAATPRDWLRATIGPRGAQWSLDPAFLLDAAYEAPLWDYAHSKHPDVAAYLCPQASLESLAGVTDAQRWIDFLLAAPWLAAHAAVELDGAQHQAEKRIDADRDRALRGAGLEVLRCPGREALSTDSPIVRRLEHADQQRPVDPDPDLVRLAHGPPAAQRLALALVELLARGHLEPAGVWELQIDDALGVAELSLQPMLDLLSAIAATWSLDIAPRAVRTAASSLVRDGVRYLYEACEAPADSRARIVLDPYVPAHAALPDHDRDLPCAVIRSTYLPTDLPWLPAASAERRDIDQTDERVDEALRVLLQTLFDHDDFRAGQLAAMRSALSGQDNVVLLPTGAGKSLIYQLVGLLRPGVTLVVDPIVALIDDQERRMQRDGIDRTSALHQARVATAAERDAAYAAVASGDSLFVFLTPERLQSQGFRDALARAAEQQLVNLAVVDEAHCVSEWGHDFRTAYLRLGRNLRLLSRSRDDRVPPLLALTGTASPAVLRDVIRELEHPGRELTVERPDTFDRPNLSYQVVTGEPSSLERRLREVIAAEVPRALGCAPIELSALQGAATRSGLIFVPHVNGRFGLSRTQDEVRTAIAAVQAAADAGQQSAGAAVDVYAGSAPKNYSGGRAGWDRHKTEAAERFKDNHTAVLVTTKAFGMGIDKPNIAWTIHLGIPSSLEAFAQEAGRAGRDGARAHCVIVATPPTDERAHALLDLQFDRLQRLTVYHRGRHDDDVQRQLFFLANNFQGVDAEYASAAPLLELLLAEGAGNRAHLPRKDDDFSGQAEKALYRLSLIGLVDDYTVDYGAKKFVIDLDTYSPASIDRAVLDFVTRVEPGKTALRQRQVADAPHELLERAQHHLRLVLETIYAVVEPARLRALAEMHQLAVKGITSEDIRARLLAYLSDGPLAGILLDLATQTRLDARQAISVLNTVPAEDPRDWVGAAARQLEGYPDHPLLLLVRGLGEALLVAGNSSLVLDSLRAAFNAMPAYGVSTADAVSLFEWSAAQLRNQPGARSWPHVASLHLAWQDSSYPAEALHAVGNQVLGRAGVNPVDPGELRAVLANRLHAAAAQVGQIVPTTTSSQPQEEDPGD